MWRAFFDIHTNRILSQPLRKVERKRKKISTGSWKSVVEGTGKQRRNACSRPVLERNGLTCVRLSERGEPGVNRPDDDPSDGLSLAVDLSIAFSADKTRRPVTGQ